MSRLLVVDDEPSICWGLSRVGEKLGHEVLTAASAEQALEMVKEQKPDVIVLDVRLPGMDGLTAIEHLREHVGDAPIIVITAYGDLQTAVEAVRRGAHEYIVKPFDAEKVRQALVSALQRPPEPPRSEPSRGDAVAGFVGRTPAMQEVFNQLALAAASDACVLLQGESGSGKELAARAIHRYSRRAAGPFVAVNVASLSPSLAESELFGHVAGAFTGADRRRIGLLAQADGGTLFLDEVADIPLPLQVKLLRVLEERHVVPVGAGEPVKADFRIISATHQDLLQRVQEREFRHDLYYRIAAFTIRLPALRERRDDVIPLVEHFLAMLQGHPVQPGQLTDATRDVLRQRDWFGNVRELRNCVEHALIMARGGPLEPRHLPAPTPAAAVGGPGEPSDPAGRITSLLREWTEQQLDASDSPTDQLYDRLLALVEPPVLERILARNSGQCAASARILGLHRTTLRRKLEQYGIEQDR